MKFRNLPIIKKFAIVFGIIAFLFIVNISFVFIYQKAIQSNSETKVNLAGKNRTLSQKINALGLRLMNGDQTAKVPLALAINEHDSALIKLSNGGIIRNQTDKIEITPVGPLSVQFIDENVIPVWKEYKIKAELILNQSELFEAIEKIGDQSTQLLEKNKELVNRILTDDYLRYQPNEKRSMIINIAGRNRMLSQRIGLLAIQVANGKQTSAAALKNAIELHDASLLALRNGGQIPNSESTLPEASEKIKKQIDDISELWQSIKSNANIILESKEVFKASKFLNENAEKLLSVNNELVNTIVNEYDEQREELNFSLNLVLVLIFVISLIIIFTSLFVVRKFVVNPLLRLVRAVDQLAKGIIPEKLNFKQNDEMGSLNDSILKMTENVDAYAEFSKRIGDGDFDYEFKPASEDDTLGNSLQDMRSQLKKVEEEDKKRNWTNQGMAKFSDIMRSNSDSLDKFCTELVQNIVKYVNANQGCFYTVNTEDENDTYIELKATYAYDRLKYNESKLRPGDGLIGQAYLEKEIIYLTEIPKNYISITSGLGEAPPDCIIIIPLLFEGKVLGVIEMAAFEKFEDYKIDFLKTLGESIAATLNTAKVNDTTKKLLAESNSFQEDLRSQEEELRQTMEEMQATQDSMETRERDLLNQISELEKQLREKDN